MLDASTLQQRGQFFRLGDIRCADQDRPTRRTDRENFFDDRFPFVLVVEIDQIGRIDVPKRFIGRNGDNVEFVDLPEFTGLGHGGSGHARQLAIEGKIFLQGDGCQRLRFLLDGDAIALVLGLNRLMETIAPLSSKQRPARELIDDDDLLLAFVSHHHVMPVADIERLRFQGIIEKVRPFHIAGRVETLHARQFFRFPNARIGQMATSFLLLDLVVVTQERLLAGFERCVFRLAGSGLSGGFLGSIFFLQFNELNGDGVGLFVALHVAECGAGNNQGGTGFVDEDVVDLVDDGKIEFPLHLPIVRVIVLIVPAGGLHVVAQEIEAELAVGSVGNVAFVSLAAWQPGPCRFECNPH